METENIKLIQGHVTLKRIKMSTYRIVKIVVGFTVLVVFVCLVGLMSLVPSGSVSADYPPPATSTPNSYPVPTVRPIPTLWTMPNWQVALSTAEWDRWAFYSMTDGRPFRLSFSMGQLIPFVDRCVVREEFLDEYGVWKSRMWLEEIYLYNGGYRAEETEYPALYCFKDSGNQWHLQVLSSMGNKVFHPITPTFLSEIRNP